MTKIQFVLDSMIGPLYVVTSKEGLHGIYWKKKEVPIIRDLTSKTGEVKQMKMAIKEIKEYLDGKRVTFDIPLILEGTEFQMRVWRELQKIPYGESVSYKDIANKLKTKAIRAVGSANGKNPISLIVPCHRVIATGGGLGGYAGGLPIKRILLDLEKRVMESRK